MMRVVLALLFSSALTGVATAQPHDPPPLQCRPDAARATDWRACYNATEGSPWRMLAAINLGTDAYIAGDYAAAARFYDEARPPNGQQLYSDVAFHAYRAATYAHVGRAREAQADADTAFRMLHHDATIPVAVADAFPINADIETVYALIVPILKDGDQTQYQAALGEFRALPTTDWISFANRSAVLEQVGDLAGALEMSSQAVAMAPAESGALNNHCYILFESGRASEALPFCERALAGAPGAAPVHGSLADVLGALGRCDEALRESATARRLDPTSQNYNTPTGCVAH